MKRIGVMTAVLVLGSALGFAQSTTTQQTTTTTTDPQATSTTTTQPGTSTTTTDPATQSTTTTTVDPNAPSATTTTTAPAGTTTQTYPSTTTQTTTTRVESDRSGDEWDWNHGSIGVFADYFRLNAADTNNIGIGGRAAFAVHPNVHLEGEIAYDFRESHTATISSGLTTTTYQADFRVLHGLFGPKFQTTGPVRVFGVLKGGFVNFSISTTGAPAGFVNSFGGVVDGDTHAVLYPGGGVELGAKWFAIRGEVGDEIYWADGPKNNFRLTVGPVFRF